MKFLRASLLCVLAVALVALMANLKGGCLEVANSVLSPSVDVGVLEVLEAPKHLLSASDASQTANLSEVDSVYGKRITKNVRITPVPGQHYPCRRARYDVRDHPLEPEMSNRLDRGQGDIRKLCST